MAVSLFFLRKQDRPPLLLNQSTTFRRNSQLFVDGLSGTEDELKEEIRSLVEKKQNGLSALGEFDRKQLEGKQAELKALCFLEEFPIAYRRDLGGRRTYFSEPFSYFDAHNKEEIILVMVYEEEFAEENVNVEMAKAKDFDFLVGKEPVSTDLEGNALRFRQSKSKYSNFLTSIGEDGEDSESSD